MQADNEEVKKEEKKEQKEEKTETKGHVPHPRKVEMLNKFLEEKKKKQ